jgi:spore coat polysaccharide biosynthesis protein SpsF
LSKSRPRVLAIIQAQTGSGKNLGGDVLRPVAGRPLLQHVVDGLKRSALIDDLAVLTGTDTRDDAIVEFANAGAIHVVRCAEDDALSSFARCAETFGADFLVRVASVAPDAGFVDHLLSTLMSKGGDYVVSADQGTMSEAVDVFSRRALDRLMMDARTDLLARREVTGYFRAFPDFVRIVRAPAWPAKPPVRVEHLDLVEAAQERLAAKDSEASLGDLMALLERNPTSDRSAYARQALPSGTTALIRSSGDALDHDRVRRAIALARSLRDSHGIQSTFAVSGSKDTLDLVRRSGFAVEHVATLDDSAALSEIVSARTPDLLVLDCDDGPSLLEVKRLKRGLALMAVIEDLSSRRLVADAAYYAPLPRVEQLDWRGAHTIVRIGWKWALLGGAPMPARVRAPSPRPTVLVRMGDSTRLTLLAARALAILPSAFRARFVIRAAGAERSRLARAIVTLKPGFETIEGADDLSIEYASADIALAAFGAAAYELAAAGVPTLYLGLTQDDAEASSAFEHAGMGISLGVASEASDDSVAGAVKQLLSDPARQRDMRAAALMTIDMNGASRIAADLATMLSQRLSEPGQATSA